VNNTAEIELVRAAQNGDREAIATLVKRYSSRVYSLALRIMRNREDAEDVLQETFLLMINKIHTFSGRSSFYTWLYRVATNVALGKLREKKPVDTGVSIHEPEFETLRAENLRHWPEHLEERINDREFRDILERAMEALPENYRTVFVLRDLENLSTRETAEVLNITEANVKVRLMRARLFLRDQLAQYLGDGRLVQ
jgi:RNA polymerase sigma-70 factor (ECF subfamily)